MITSSTVNENVVCGITAKIKPMKRHLGLKQFSREHHFALLLIWKIRQGLKTGIATERISRYLLFFYRHGLKPHFCEEEKTLFPKLAENDVMRKQATNEHRRMELLASYVESDIDNSGLLTEFADTLEMHIRFEERTLFNLLQNVLSESEMESLQLNHSEEKSDIDKEWDDHFWSCK